MTAAPPNAAGATRRSPWASRRRFAAAWLALLALGVMLRAYHLGVEPKHNETADEYAWTWSGMTLLATGQPQAWSWLPAYGDFPVIQWRGNPYKLVTPWLDHPPLYSVFMGAWMRAWGATNILDVNLATMRWSSVALFVLLFTAMGWALCQHLGPGATLLALLLLASAPPAVLQNRLVVSENFWTPLTLIAYALLATDARRPSRWTFAALVLCVAALPLSKIAALASCFALFVMALHRGSWRLSLAVGGGTLIGLLLYFGYGWAVGGDLFLNVLQSQRNRFSGLGGFHALLFEQTVVTHSMHYLPFVLGMVACVALCIKRRPVEWALPVPCYAGAMAFFVNQNELYGWYFLPLYPWFAAGAAALLARAWRTRQPHLVWVWSLFVVTGALATMQDLHLLAPETVRQVFLAGLLFASGALWIPRTGRLAAKPIAGISLAALVGTNLLWILAR